MFRYNKNYPNDIIISYYIRSDIFKNFSDILDIFDNFTIIAPSMNG